MVKFREIAQPNSLIPLENHQLDELAHYLKIPVATLDSVTVQNIKWVCTALKSCPDSKIRNLYKKLVSSALYKYIDDGKNTITPGSIDPRLQKFLSRFQYKELVNANSDNTSFDLDWIKFLIDQGAVVSMNTLWTALASPSLLKTLLDHAELAEIEGLDESDDEHSVAARNKNNDFIFLCQLAVIRNHILALGYLLDYLEPRLSREINPSGYTLISGHFPKNIAEIIYEYSFSGNSFKSFVILAFREAITSNVFPIACFLLEGRYTDHIDFNADYAPQTPFLFSFLRTIERVLQPDALFLKTINDIINKVDLVKQRTDSRSLFVTRVFSDTKLQTHYIVNLLNTLCTQQEICTDGYLNCSPDILDELTALNATTLAQARVKLGLGDNVPISNLQIIKFLQAYNPEFITQSPSLLEDSVIMYMTESQAAKDTYDYLRNQGLKHSEQALINVMATRRVIKIAYGLPGYFIQDYLEDNASKPNFSNLLINVFEKLNQFTDSSISKKITTSLLKASTPYINDKILSGILPTLFLSSDHFPLEILDVLKSLSQYFNFRGIGDTTLIRVIQYCFLYGHKHVEMIMETFQRADISDKCIAEALIGIGQYSYHESFIPFILQKREGVDALLAEYYIKKCYDAHYLNSAWWKKRLEGETFITLEEIVVHMLGFHEKKVFGGLFTSLYSGARTLNYFIPNQRWAEDFKENTYSLEDAKITLCKALLTLPAHHLWHPQKPINTQALRCFDLAPQPGINYLSLAQKFESFPRSWEYKWPISKNKSLSLQSYIQKMKTDNSDKYKKICGARDLDELKTALSKHRNGFFKVFGTLVGKKTDGELLFEQCEQHKGFKFGV